MFPQSMHHFLHRWGPGPSDDEIPPTPTASLFAGEEDEESSSTRPSPATTERGEASRLVVPPHTGGGGGSHLQTHPLVGRGDYDSSSSSPSTINIGQNPLALAWTRATAALAEAATVHHLRILDAVRDLSSPGAAASDLLSTIGTRFQKLASSYRGGGGRNGISSTALGEYAPADPYDDEDVEDLLVSQAREIAELRERVRKLETDVNEMEEGMENRHVVTGADDSFYRRLGVDEDGYGGDGEDSEGDDEHDVLDPDGPRARMRGQRRTIRILEGRVEYLLGLINLLQMIEEMEF